MVDNLVEDNITEKKKKSLRYSIIDGSFYSAMVGFGESFFAAFAIFLNATTIQLGIIGSLPQALGSFSQLISNFLIRFFGSRKKLVLYGSLFQALMHIPIALVFFMGEFRVYHLIVFVSIYWICSKIINPAWNSWMGDLVDPEYRGRYFGLRSRILGFASFTFLIAGIILHNSSFDNYTQYIGFAIIFGIAMLCRIVSFIFLYQKYEPPYEFSPKAKFSFIDFLKQARFRNYGLFVFFLCSMNFAVYISAPFFIAYMMNDLHYDYFTYTLVIVVAMITKMASMPIWGNLSDKYGTKKMLTIASFLIPIPAFMWIISTQLWWIIFIQAFAGIIWAGFELCSFNFIFDSTKPYKRATCVSYYNVLNSFSLVLGAVVGSLIVKFNHLFWSKYYLVFIVSAVLRFSVAIFFLSKIREVRHVEEASYKDIFLSLISIRPNLGTIHHLITFKKHDEEIKDYNIIKDEEIKDYKIIKDKNIKESSFNKEDK